MSWWCGSLGVSTACSVYSQFNRFHWITWHGADLLGSVQLRVTRTGKCCSVLSNRSGLTLQQRGKCRRHWQLQWLQIRLNSPCGSKRSGRIPFFFLGLVCSEWLLLQNKTLLHSFTQVTVALLPNIRPASDLWSGWYSLFLSRGDEASTCWRPVHISSIY